MFSGKEQNLDHLSHAAGLENPERESEHNPRQKAPWKQFKSRRGGKKLQ